MAVNEELLPQLISEYDSVVLNQQSQLKMYKDEHETLKKELEQLVKENEKLIRKLDSEFKQNLAKDNPNVFKSIIESKMIVNLKEQLSLSRQEKEKTYELYLSSLKIVEKLEEEILSYGKMNSGINITRMLKSSMMSDVMSLELKMKNLKQQLELESTARENAESQSLRFQTELVKQNVWLEGCRVEMKHMKQNEDELKTKYNKLDQDYVMLNATYGCVVKTRDELEKRIESADKRILSLVKNNNEGSSKVEEALDIIEKLTVERDSAVVRESQLQDQVSKLQLSLQHIITEAGKRVGTEIEVMKKKYGLDNEELLRNMQTLKSELEDRTADLKDLNIRYKKLERLGVERLEKEKISLIKGSETEITILESQLRKVYQEFQGLRLSYEEVMSEKGELEEDLRKVGAEFEAELREKNVEVEQSKEEVVERERELWESSRRAEMLVKEIQELQTEVSERENCECVSLRNALEKTRTQVIDLEKCLESQKNLNEKWKAEVRDLTEMFQKKLNQVKKDSSKMKKRLKDA